MATEEKFDCVFCKEAFDDKETLQVHFRKHGDPKFDLSTKTLSKNRSPCETALMEKIGEESDLVGCDVCEEVFPTISKAITHKHKAHPDHDSKYFCPFCGKLFTMKHLLNKHIQSNHDCEELAVSKDFHCDMCEVTFTVPSAMLYHNKFFHRQDTEIPAVGTSKKVKLLSQEMLQIYYCSFCGEEFHNKVNLHKHIGDDHCDENQSPNEVLRCPLCEAIFYHLDAYEIHLTFHSSEDLYSEKNELVDQITEFSLETVAPIMENVIEEDLETPPKEDVNSDGINNFLQLVMGDQSDGVPMEKIKHKKHKKHKKSKKASITLDEFLNMNKDVFGDGLGDVQGIEEVPTQVVLKKAKSKAQNRNEAKMVNADLAKLKKQGIVVKTKPKSNTSVTNLNITKAKQLISGNVKKSNLLQKSSNDILSKLLNQGNSQIKIVKKPASQSSGGEHDGTDVLSDAINELTELNSLPPDNEIKNNAGDSTPSVPEAPLGNSTLAYSEASNITDDIRNENHDAISRSPDCNDKEISADKLYHSECSKTSNEMSNYEDKSNSTLEKKIDICDNKLSNVLQEKRSRSPDNTVIFENHHDKEDNDDVNYETYNYSSQKSETNDATKTPLSALKHLSHLITVKPLANQGKDTIRSNLNEEIKAKDTPEANDENMLAKNVGLVQDNPLNKVLMSCGQITLKKPTQIPLSSQLGVQADPYSDATFQDDLETDNLKVKNNDKTKKTLIEMKELKLELVPLPQSICDLYVNKNDEDSNDFATDQTMMEKREKTVDSRKEARNIDILKRLPNVTAKPINVAKVMNQRAVNMKPYQGFMPKGLQPKKITKGIDEEIEVFNIDDSDEETESDALNNESELKTGGGIPTDVFKNLSKNIIVKSSETKTIPSTVKNINVQANSLRAESYTQFKQSKAIQKSINLQNKLKTLGNITVKSNNPSPNVYNKGFEDYEEDQDESGSDSENIGRVKITELDQDYMSDGEFNDHQPNSEIQSPNESNSENEDNHKDFDDDLSDVESHIKMNTLKKSEVQVLKNTMPNLANNLKNLNKSLIIKPINTKNAEQVSSPASNMEVPEDTSNNAHELPIKPHRPNVAQNEQTLSKNIHQPSGSSNQTSLNQKVNSASNQVNTVKTVNTVKRFQSQTVIEEITTTVTKTIRTVNSSTNEVMQSTSQNISKTQNRPSTKIINKQPGRELQSKAIRHVSPTIGTKIRNAVPVARSPNATIVRPSNQLVPVRPVFNRPRLPAPSTSAVRNVVPRCNSPQKPAIGKLKISPHALSQTIKRPSDEALCQFTTFKKPKDMITAQDLPEFSDDDSSMQYSSSTQSRSDISSVTKKAKGIVTATQTRSEVSTSSQQQIKKGIGTSTQMRSEVCMSSHQQLSRLNNMSGLKVVKTSAKQAMQVEERCEINPSNRNTLEAIEKLQRQGLLVKKPRIEDQSNSFSESDDENGEQ